MSGPEELTRRQRRWVGRRKKSLFNNHMKEARSHTAAALAAIRPLKSEEMYCSEHGKVPTVHQHYDGDKLACGLCRKKARSLEDVQVLRDTPYEEKDDRGEDNG